MRIPTLKFSVHANCLRFRGELKTKAYTIRNFEQLMKSSSETIRGAFHYTQFPGNRWYHQQYRARIHPLYSFMRRLKIKFANNAVSNKLVSIHKGNYELSWNMEGTQSSVAKKAEPDLSKFNALSDDDKKKTVIKNTSGVNFSNVLPDTDLNYIINGNTVKENIVINKVPENAVYSFNLSTKKLIPVLQTDKSVILYDEKDLTKGVFKIPAPFMYDTKHVESRDIEVSLTKTNSGYSLSLKPNKDWLNSPERSFPVVLDPVVSTSLNWSAIHDTWVSSGLPTENRDNSVLLGVGYGSISQITRTYIKFDLPTLTSADLVTNAKLYLSLYSDQSNVRQTNVHRVNTNWDSTTLTWNNAPGFNPKVEDYAMVNGVAGNSFNWDVTGIVKDWYTTGNNSGLMLKNQDETVGYDEFFSADTSGTYEPYRAQVVLFYVNNSGLESYWTYHSQDVGRAGTGYVNDYNGNVIFSHNDLAMNGNKMPISLNHVYNSNDKETSIGYGKGWRLNLSQRIEEKPINNVQYYIYTDGDGTKHYYTYDSSRSAIVDELSPTDSTLIKNADGTYNIKDKKNNQLNFTALGIEGVGYLLTMIDSNGNTLSLGYNGAILNRIIDGAGRVTTLDLTPEGYLIGIIDPANRRTSFSYSGVQLTTITYPDGTTTKYTYDTANKLTSAAYNNGYKITYEYYTAEPYRVKKVLETHGDGTLGNELNISYGNNTTFFTDVKGRKNSYQFNYSGNTINVTDADGNAEYYKYLSGTNENKKLSLESKLQKTVINFLKNHNIEQSGYWTEDYWTAPRAPTVLPQKISTWAINL